MSSSMDQNTFLDFYKNTMLLSSKNLQRFVCGILEEKHRITYDEQISIQDNSQTMYFPSKRELRDIISKTTKDSGFVGFYEDFEFRKLYKYSVPLFFEGNSFKEMFEKKNIQFFQANEYSPKYIIDRTLKDATPIVLEEGDVFIVKFVLQKVYVQPETYEQIDYRYPILIYIDAERGFLEIRYDALRSGEQFDNEAYGKIVSGCVNWLKENLELELYTCEHADTIKNINDKKNTDVIMYKQMMQMEFGGSAELTASEGNDYLLPFIGEIRELIDENEELFREAEDIKSLLLNYLSDKEATASYPYIYVKWLKPVESQSCIVKITFDYFFGKYTLLQHITGNCKDLGMGRMNDAIEYLSKSGSFVKGEKI